MLHGMLFLLASLASLGPLSFADTNTPDPWAPDVRLCVFMFADVSRC